MGDTLVKGLIGPYMPATIQGFMTCSSGWYGVPGRWLKYM